MTVNFLKRIAPYVLIAFIAVSSVLVFSSCRTNNMSNKERQIQKEKKRRSKDDTVLYQKALKKHMKNQTKATRKDMKRNYRESQRYNSQKKEFFLKRIIRDKLYQRQKKQKG
jgi:pyruvate/2-oxoacid:ferredoxin oxidoreductase beta subunit